MTPLAKPVYRETRTSVRDRGTKRRVLVAGLLPGDVIELRMKGTRQRFLLSVEAAYYHAVRLRVQQALIEKAAKRKAQRRAR